VIRQAISCDICGAEKKQTNHWFVACEQGPELRLSGWSSQIRQRPGTKHLCGQTCLHKLVDEYIARTIGARLSSAATEAPAATGAHREVDASLTTAAAFGKPSPGARVARSQAIAEVPPALRASEITTPALVSFPPRPIAEPVATAPLPPQPDAPQFTSRRWRAEAWERERNRASDRHFDLSHRRKGF